MDTDSLEQEHGAAVSGEASRRLAIFSERLFTRLAPDAIELFPTARRGIVAERAFDFFCTRAEPIKVRCIADDNAVVVETAMADCAFIVDSIHEYFRAREFPVRMLLHPIYQVARDAGGEIVSFELASVEEKRESFTHSELDIAPDPNRLNQIEADLRRILTQVVAATSDFSAMKARALQICQETARQRELVEIRDFLRWLVQDTFVFLGYRHYLVERDQGQQIVVLDTNQSLGIMRVASPSRYAKPVPVGQLDEAHRKLLFEESPLVVAKTHAEAEVHRRAAMDDITIRRSDQNGQATGFDRFIGLFTSKAYSEEAEHIPVLRSKLNDLLQAEGLRPEMHDYKATVAAFNGFPKEELFRARLPELRSQIRLVLDLQNEDEVRLSLQTDSVRGNVIALVVMPRQQFSAEVRIRIQEALCERLGGTLVYYYLALGLGHTARLHFCLAAPPPGPHILPLLRAEIASLARSWESLLRERLSARYGHEHGHQLAARWLPAFTARYKNTIPVEAALGDIQEIEKLLLGGRFSVVIGGGAEARQNSSELRLYQVGEAPLLSELIPILQNFGISVVSEEAYEFRLELNGKTQLANLQSFRVRSAEGRSLEAEPGAALLGPALVAVRTGQAEDDRLNLLTLTAGLSWREVALLRAYLAAAFQMRLIAARNGGQRPFLSCPQLARFFIDAFRARFDPDKNPSGAETESLRAAYLEQLAAIDNIIDDRTARTLLGMIEATVRTNFFQPSPQPVPYIALKFESARIPNLPDTAPLYELHVNSPVMEGCHLRAGKIARGGIRHSERRDDYRTEILDLMKTQTVKNAIIVPIGAKGGFIVKPPAGRLPGPHAAIEAYSTLIKAMLDLSDNVVAQQIVRPPRVRLYDDDGPYLVVAADKGTASYSDIANAIAQERHFWLGDAFASGGEHGYDHKKMGITARGAWESARRHLREMGRDLRGAPVTMVGIGDMSGDVFGNGLLQSDNIKLIAAFDHRHIFIDPNPDPKTSYAERRRLYKLPNSQWSDYDAALISKGGGIFRRGQKQIAVTPEARAALKCGAREVDADTLIQHILCAEVDMLYNGGIGTYVRASGETDAEVGDHANDSCRVAASDLRCEIVVEGGNLGLTQRARIEFALRGGRINTDAIDNSAGVDMSDHEVNLKILLEPALNRGELSLDERNRYLAAAANEVARAVLEDNRDQALSLSLEQRRSRYSISAFRDHLAAIEERGLLHHQDPVLPSREQWQERRAMQRGLTRPELAVMTAYTKIDLASRLGTKPLAEDPYLVARFLQPYFPPQVASSFSREIARHRLRRELLATSIVNQTVDVMGSTFVFELMRDHGVVEDDAVRAFLIAEGVLDLRGRAAKLHAGAQELTAEAEAGAFMGLEQAMRHTCAWALTSTPEPGSLGQVVLQFKPAFDQLAAEFETLLQGGERTRFESTYRELRAAVHHENLALDLARLSFAQHILNVLTVSFSESLEIMEVAHVYFGLSEHIEFAMLESAIDSIRTDDRWERRAASDLAAELLWARMQLCRSVLSRDSAKRSLPVRVAEGRERRAAEVEQLMAELRALPSVGLPPLQVAVRALARLAAGN